MFSFNLYCTTFLVLKLYSYKYGALIIQLALIRHKYLLVKEPH